LIEKRRSVIDTNVLVSALLRPGSISFHAVEKAFMETTVLSSRATREELLEVLNRPKFGQYYSADDRRTYLKRVGSRTQLVPIETALAVCRDPKDEKFLELALHGSASFILSSDTHLLEMNPFRGITIMTPTAYLKL
jgi:putative PIN family toxin of toxin-antitoxin system